MKNIIFIIALFVTSTSFAAVSSDVWVVNQNGIPVIASQNKLSSQETLLGYDTCNQLLILWDQNYSNLKETQTIDAKFRVDRNDVFNGELSYLRHMYSDGERMVYVAIEADEEFVKQMILGDTLRIQYKDELGNWSDSLIERYSLKGFTSAVTKSLSRCSKQDSQYFNATKDSDFF